MGNFSGLFITIDDLEILISRSSLELLHYTKMKREDTYESIRQLIDDIDSMSNIMFVYAFDRELMDNENTGLKSYQALWMRIQNEIVGERFNCFTDMVDLDRFAAQEYTPEIVVSMSEKFAESEKVAAVVPLDLNTAKEIVQQAHTGVVGIPGLIREAMREEKADV